MATEIERKFVIDSGKLFTSDNIEISSRFSITQHYLPSAPNQVVRIRKYYDHYEMGIKFIKSSIERDEIEFRILNMPAEELIKHSLGFVEKVRYVIYHNNIKWDVDLYRNLNNLAIAEIEFGSTEEAKKEIKLPDWIIKEVTGISKYSNYILATSGGKIEL